jgi:putative PIN family toxin of toxin-antitoxin system
VAIDAEGGHRKVKLVIDTNVLISAMLNPSAPPSQLVAAWRAKAFTLLSTDLQLTELSRVTRYPKIKERLKPAIAGELVNDVRALAVFAEPLPASASQDPYDNFLLGLADAGKAQLLVTGDKRDLLSLGAYKGIRIVNTQSALGLLGK